MLEAQAAIVEAGGFSWCVRVCVKGAVVLERRMLHVNVLSQGFLYRGLRGAVKSPMCHMVQDDWKVSGFGAADEKLSGYNGAPLTPSCHCSSPS